MLRMLRPALVLFLVLSIVTGIAYPWALTGLARAAFPVQAAGSLVLRDGKPVGSALIGQTFDEPAYFWGRPSATADAPNNGLASGGANLGPTNPALLNAVKARVAVLKAADPAAGMPIPADLVSTSASGLDPHIGVEAARYQAARVARLRRLPVAQVEALIDAHTEAPLLAVIGPPVVNVLALNLALDASTTAP